MGLVELCVGFVAVILVWTVSFLLGRFVEWILSEDDEIGLLCSNTILSIALGICLTYILFDKGLI